jgi:hypothetical protein
VDPQLGETDLSDEGPSEKVEPDAIVVFVRKAMAAAEGWRLSLSLEDSLL